MIKKLNKKIKSLTFSFLFLLLTLCGTIIPNTVSTPKADNSIDSWIMCSFKTGKEIYNRYRTDLLYYELLSKSAQTINESSNNFFNGMLSVAGYNFNNDVSKNPKLNPFDVFGMSGLHWSNYAGEWKYYEVDGCVDNDRQEGIKKEYGKFYTGRKEVKYTFNETATAKDVRASKHSAGLFSNWWKGFLNTIANFFLWISKFIMSITLSLLSLTFTDISSFIGLTQKTEGNIFKNLYTNFYMPLTLFMITLTAGYLIWKGLIKRELRTTFGAIAKIFLVMTLANVLVLSPNLMTIPNTITTFGQGIVISAFNNTSTKGKKDDLCNSEIGLDNVDTDNDKNYMEKINKNIRSNLGCKMWKEFLFKPWVKAQFGTDYEKLDKLENINSKWVKDPKVKLGVEKTVTNWGLFQLSTQTDKHKTIDEKDSPLISGVHKDWWRIADALSNYDETGVDTPTGTTGNIANNNGGSGSSGGTKANEFIQQHLTEIKSVAEKYGVYPSVMLGQAFLESGILGRGSALANPPNHNLFGIKCRAKDVGTDNCVNLGTTEWENGKFVGQGAWFRKYNSYEESFRDYAIFLRTNPRYRNALPENAGSAEASIVGIANAGYATDPTYASKVLNLMNTYNLQQYDEGINFNIPSNEDLGVTGDSGNSNGAFTGTSGGYWEQVDSKPLKEWQYWIGNHTGERMGTALLMTIFTILGSLPALLFGFMGAIYGIGITLLMTISPIFLTLGLWQERGQQMFMSWFSLLMSTILKKIVASLLLMLSIIMVTNMMGLINDLGWIKTVTLVAITSYLIAKNRHTIINSLASINLGTYNLVNGWTKITNVGKKTTRFAKNSTVSAVGGGIGAVKTNQNTFSGMKEGMKNYLHNEMYRTKVGTQFAGALRTGQQSAGKPLQNVKCSICFTSLDNEQKVYQHPETGFYICKACLDELDNPEEALEVNINSKGRKSQEEILQQVKIHREKLNLDKMDNSEIEQYISQKNRQSYKSFVSKTKAINKENDEVVLNLDKVKQEIEKNITKFNDETRFMKESKAEYTSNFKIPELIQSYVNPTALSKALETNNWEALNTEIEQGYKNWFDSNKNNIYKIDKNGNIENLTDEEKMQEFNDILNDKDKRKGEQ